MKSLVPKIDIIYDAFNGHVVPDGKVQNWVDSIVESGTIIIGSELMLHALRVSHCSQKISVNSIIFRVNGSLDVSNHVLIDIDQNGSLTHWPKGFADYTEDFLYNLLGWR